MMSRKRTFLDNFSIEEDVKSDNVKKKKCSITKLQPTKTEAEKPITRKKNIKETKSQVAYKNSTNNNTSETSIGNNDITSDSTQSISISESSVSRTPAESLLKVPKKRVTSTLKKPVLHNKNNDVIVKNGKNDNAVSLKSTKVKTSPVKVKFAFNMVNYNKKSSKLETSNASKTLKNCRSKECIKSVKNKSTKNSLNKDESLNKAEKSNNVVTSKTPKNKASKSMTPKKKSVLSNGNKNGGPSKILEIDHDSVTETASKNKKSKSVTPNKKKNELISINKNGTSDKIEENSPSKVPRKCNRSILNKLQSQNLHETVINNSATIYLQKYEPPCSAELNDNSMMLRSNKPPKIKKKWSDEWSGNKSSNSMLKLNVDNHTSISEIKVNNCDDIFKKLLKLHKPKTSNCKKLRMMDKLNINGSHSVDISNTFDVVENSITNFPEKSNSLVKLNVDHSSVPETEVNNCDNTMNNPLKIQKPESSNCKKLKTKMMEKLNIYSSHSVDISESCDVIENSITNFPEIPNSLLKLNVGDYSSVSEIEVSNCDDTIKKPIKIQKPKTSNCNKHETEMIEKLNINDSLSVDISDICDAVENSSTNFPEAQNCDAELITNISPIIATSVSESDDIMVPSESNDIDLQISNCSNLLHLATITTALTSLPISASSQPTTFTALPPIPSTSTSPPVTYTALSSSPSASTILPTFAEVPNIISGNENHSQSHSLTYEPMGNSSFLPVPEREISYGISILSEAISRQCNESMNINTTTSVEQSYNEIKSSPKKTNSSTTQFNVPSQKTKKNKSRKPIKRFSEIPKQSMESISQSRIEREICLLSKRFNIPNDVLKKTVIEEPLSVFKEKYSPLACPSMVTVSPVTEYAKHKLSSRDHITGNLNVQYEIEPIRESAAYEKTNLVDMMLELSKTMPSWSLSIVSNPPRYVISHMSINKYGVPIANKSIVLDDCFRASVYINHCLVYKYCKRYTTGTEIINLIKDLNSL